ncbi:hypothetical protein D0T53_12840 [Dysgonomonas sp. 216]|uniref:hypothetical protein n=1 Tax=Dysgonomonas sp. 216 TaxID=2302934 RepID=UPI0013D01372|nr:hypothetical protein [Dysgonomonas sp. 216]NDW19786.1 hypothetical protein [Dysgonomonas sp. 216]
MKDNIVNRIINCFILLFTILLLLSISGCKTKTVYVPVESFKTEYRDRLLKDSIHILDSVFVERWNSNDTVYLTKEKYKYLYRDKLVRDTICKTDSIAVPYPVIETKEVNRLHRWQQILMCIGVLFTGLMGYKIVMIIKKFKM